MSFAEQQYRAHIERQRRLRKAELASETVAAPDPAESALVQAEPLVSPVQTRTIEALQQQVAQLSARVKAIARADQSPLVLPRLIKPVISAVAKYYDVSLGDLVSCRRTRDVVWARHVAMYLAKELTEHSLPTIGRVFARSHSSVLHACRRIAALRLEHAELDADLRELTDLLTRPIPDLPGDRSDGVEHE
ncbi:MAG TPA: helix-turn-helix domain-containing protein [Xanthobacteraceae bacterium]|nr:helix-turn-helix domain-containing protein [Xanthobacteraceae bacterium]